MPESREHLFVINPKSFITQTEIDNVVFEIDGYFKKSGETYYIHLSRFPRDAITVIRKYISNVGEGTVLRVYAIGGDGILFDCLNGIIGFSNAELAVIPYGTSNDFVRSFGEGKEDLFRNIALQAVSPTIQTDIMFAANMYALNTCTIGLEGYSVHRSIELSEKYARLLKRLSPKLKRICHGFIYWWSGILSLLVPEILHQKYEISIDGEKFDGSYAAINVANGPCYGSDKSAAIAAIPNDGLLDVLLLKIKSNITVIPIVTKYVYGGYAKYPQFISYNRGKEIKIHSERPMVIQLDGEIFFENDLTVSIIPEAVKIVAVNDMEYKRRAVLP